MFSLISERDLAELSSNLEVSIYVLESKSNITQLSHSDCQPGEKLTKKYVSDPSRGISRHIKVKQCLRIVPKRNYHATTEVKERI